MTESFKYWCYKAHADVNHLYNDYIPYRFHLEIVTGLVFKYKHIAETLDIKLHVLEAAADGHDVIEDTRKTYNDVFRELCRYMPVDDAKCTVEMIFAVTNNTGRTRAERADDAYYHKIRSTHGAIFIKLCDRIANVMFGTLVNGRMFKMYKEENEKFLHQLFPSGDESTEYNHVLMLVYSEMVDDLDNLLK